jgi:hypothetical protein
MISAGGAVEDLSNIDPGTPFMDALHRLVVGILVDRQDKLCGFSIIQVIA